MRKETKEYNIYKYKELSEQAKETALNNYIENNQYDFLEEDIKEYAKELLNEKGIKSEDLKVFYDLSYSQGSGSQLNGTFHIGDTTIYIKQSGHYYHEKAIEYIEEDKEGIEQDNKHYDIFQEIFKELTKYGYNHIDNENSEENFKELCELNGYEFLENGDMW